MPDETNLSVNTTPNYNPNTTGTDTLSAENKVFYQRELIRFAEAELIHGQFGQKRPIPPHGGKRTEFRQMGQLPEMTTPLVEGVTPEGQSMEVHTVTAEIQQYGGYVTLSDILELTAIDNTIVEATQAIASQGGRTIDSVYREILNAGTNVMYGGGVASRAALHYTSGENNCNMTVDLIRRAVRTLKKQNAPRIDGYYVAIVHPDVAYDIMSDKNWKDPNTYKDSVKNIFNGELGSLYGVRFVENPRAKVFEKAGATPSGTGAVAEDVYSTLFLGADAYGVIPLEGAGMEHIVKPKGSGGTADPLNQRSTVGWICATTAVILVQQYLLRVETTATH